MELANGDIKLKPDTTSVAAHLRRRDQFFGLAGSSGPSHVTNVESSLSLLKSRLGGFSGSLMLASGND